MNVPFEQRGTYLLTGGGNTKLFLTEALERTGVDNPIVTIDRSGHPAYKKEDPGVAWQSIYGFFAERGLKVNDLEPCIEQGSALDTLASTDLLYVCGGSTRLLTNTWDHLGITPFVQERIQNRQLVVAGGSAGAMVWFKQGYSDSYYMEHPDQPNWRYITAQGIGSFPNFVTAHYSDIDDKGFHRAKGFHRYLQRHIREWDNAFGLDTWAGMLCVDGVATATELHTPQQRLQLGHDQQSIHHFSHATGAKPRRLENGEQIQLFPAQ